MYRRFLLLLFLFLPVLAYSQRYSQRKYRDPVESTGFCNGVDFSVNAGFFFSSGVDYVASYQFNPYLQAGAGVGVQPSAFLFGGSAFMFPFYLDLRYNILPTPVTPFLGIKAGGVTFLDSHDVECHYYLSVMPGCRVNTGGSKSVSFSLGVSLIPVYDYPDRCEHDVYIDPETGPTEMVPEKKIWTLYPSLSFRVFYQF